IEPDDSDGLHDTAPRRDVPDDDTPRAARQAEVVHTITSTLTGITDAQIERAREEEDVLQFVMRGAIRKRDFGGDYDIYLYT
ncbi:hypothetical protein, partial [Salmonella enterica]|uniref:hypothetical protein n=1 Tax=Salmonella enterica TaxID=28901 RepID=UPI001A7E0520